MPFEFIQIPANGQGSAKDDLNRLLRGRQVGHGQPARVWLRNGRAARSPLVKRRFVALAKKSRRLGDVPASASTKPIVNDRRGRLFALTAATAVFLTCIRCPAVVVADPGGLAAAQALAANPSYASVGWVGIHEGSSDYRGSGVLIAPEWVLTAAHNWLANEVTGLEFHIAGTTYTASSGDWLQHPGWLASPGVDYTQGSDIALIHLSAPVTGIAPAVLYGGVAELGALITLVGAGSAGTAATGPRPNPTPLLYATTNVIDRVITSGVTPAGLLGMDFDDGSASHNTLAGSAIYDTLGHQVALSDSLTVLSLPSSTSLSLLEGTSAAGDSGGPAFADFGNGPEVVGLVSWGVNPSNLSNPYGSGAGDVTYLTRVSAFNDWIYTTIPEPGVASLVLAAALPFLCHRRRQGF